MNFSQPLRGNGNVIYSQNVSRNYLTALFWEDGMEWYLSLTIHQRINMKGIAKMITGVSWSDMGIFFNIKERIEIIHGKLKDEGFGV